MAFSEASVVLGTRTLLKGSSHPVLAELHTATEACKQMSWLGFVIAMVTGIHFVEAYLLNPAIYSAHLKLHPLLVISTLVVAEHSLGVWGLLLAVPLTVFALDYCIRFPAESMKAVAARELEIVSVDFGDM
ncbi:TPA: hypothetical protein ACH3X3_009492 [Trebouxia sp. C0006]